MSREKKGGERVSINQLGIYTRSSFFIPSFSAEVKATKANRINTSSLQNPFLGDAHYVSRYTVKGYKWKLTEDEPPFAVTEDPGAVADGFVRIAASETPERITIGALDATHTHCSFFGTWGRLVVGGVVRAMCLVLKRINRSVSLQHLNSFPLFFVLANCSPNRDRTFDLLFPVNWPLLVAYVHASDRQREIRSGVGRRLLFCRSGRNVPAARR